MSLFKSQFFIELPIVLPIVLPIELPINCFGGRYVMTFVDLLGIPFRPSGFPTFRLCLALPSAAARCTAASRAGPGRLGFVLGREAQAIGGNRRQ